MTKDQSGQVPREFVVVSAVVLGASLAVATLDKWFPEPEPRTEWPESIRRLDVFVSTFIDVVLTATQRRRRHLATDSPDNRMWPGFG